MEANDSFDRLFKNKLSDNEAAVPAGSWQSISQKVAIQKENKSKGYILPFPLFWIAASFLAGSVAGISSYYVYDLKKENEGLKQLIVYNNSDILRRTTTAINETQIAEKHELEEKYTFNLKGNLSDKLKNAHPFIVPVHYRYKNFDAYKGSKSGRLVSMNPSKRNNKNNLIQEGDFIHNVLSDDQNIDSGNKRNESIVFQTSTTVAKPIHLLSKIDSLKTKIDTIYIPQKIAEVEQDKKIKKAVRIMGFPISVGMYFTPEMASRTVNFSENTDPDIVKYKQKDERKFGFSAGFSLDLHLPKNFFVRTGVSYWNVGEKNNVLLKHSESDTTYSNSQSTTNTTTTKIIKNEIPASSIPYTGGPAFDTIGRNTNTSFVTKNNSTIETHSREIKESFSQFSSSVSNNYHYVGIPLIVGMKLSDKKLSFGLFSGVITNMLVSSSQSIYYVYYNPEQPDKYVHAKRELARFSLVYTGGVDIDYRIAKMWTVSLSPTIKYTLTSIYKNENSVKQLPYSFGLQVGVKYRLGK